MVRTEASANETSRFHHAVEIDEDERVLSIYRIHAGRRELLTRTSLPDVRYDEHPAAFEAFARTLGENLLIDSPQARRLFGL